LGLATVLEIVVVGERSAMSPKEITDSIVELREALQKRRAREQYRFRK